jgi:type VI secretion system protein ImpI
MELTLRIENQTSLPDGGPLSVTIRGQRNIDIGRDSHLDWTLPDPSRFISGKHCEVRYKDGGYWLHDVSTNGTFLNGSDHRMQAPHRLRTGDRFVIGEYIVATVVLEDEGKAPDTLRSNEVDAVDYQSLWADDGQIAPPIDSKQLKAAGVTSSRLSTDFLDWAVDIPDPVRTSAASPLATRSSDSIADPLVSRSGNSASDQMNEVDLWNEPSRGTTPAFEQAQPANEVSSASSGGPNASDGGVEYRNVFFREFVSATGLPEDLLRQRDPTELARQFGAVLRIVVENLIQLLKARAQAKRLARGSSYTLVQATENNPLKFARSANEALSIIFGPRTPSHLDAARAIEQSFENLKSHQVRTYSAMQHALRKLMADLDPAEFEKATQGARGLASLPTLRQASLWRAYRSLWQTKVGTADSGPLEVFMLYFGEYYERDER